MDLSFGKAYKLCSKTSIENLFDKGSSVRMHPYLIKYQFDEFKDDSRFKLVITAPKRQFKKAVDRNRIKRISREAIRHNKFILESFLEEQNKQLALFIIYNGKEEESAELLNKQINKLFKKIISQLNN